MSSYNERKQRAYVAIAVVGIILISLLTFFGFQLSVAMRLGSVISLTGEAMVAGFGLWLYHVYRRVKNAENDTNPSKTNSVTMLIDSVALLLFIASGVGIVAPGAMFAALWSNVVISFYVLAIYSVSGLGEIKKQINLLNLK